jgi:hypothetical protein
MRGRKQRQNREAAPSSILIHSVFFVTVFLVVLLIAVIIRTPVITPKPPQAFVVGKVSIVVVGFRKISRCVSFQGIASSRRAW